MTGLSVFTFSKFLGGEPSIAAAIADSKENAIRILVAEFVKTTMQHKLWSAYQQDLRKAARNVTRAMDVAMHEWQVTDRERRNHHDSNNPALSQAESQAEAAHSQALMAYNEFVSNYKAANPEPLRPRSSIGGHCFVTVECFEELLQKANCEVVPALQWSGVFMVGVQ